MYFIKIQQVASATTTVACLAALVIEFRIEPIIGLLISIVALYLLFKMTPAKAEKFFAFPQQTYASHQVQVLDVLKSYHLAPMLSSYSDVSQTAHYHWNDTILEIGTDAEIGSSFIKSGNQLLIIGEHGTGKTYFLLRLMRELIKLNESGEQNLIPLLIHASTWTYEKPRFWDWLVEQITYQYAIPHKIAERWMLESRLAILIDDFDDLPPDYQKTFTEELQLFFEGDLEALNLVFAVAPECLPNAPTFFNGRITLDTKLPESPLMPNLPTLQIRYPQAHHWLGWLARQMQYRKCKTFFIEDLNKDWLTQNKSTLTILTLGIAFFSITLLFTVVNGTILHLIDPYNPEIENPRSLAETMETSLFLGVMIGAIVLFFSAGLLGQSPKVVEPFRIVLPIRNRSVLALPIFAISFIPLLGLLYGFGFAIRGGLIVGIQYGLLAATSSIFVMLFVMGLRAFFQPASIETHPYPNMYLNYAINRALWSLLAGGFVSALPYVAILFIQTKDVTSGIFLLGVFGVLIGAVIGLANGGMSVIQHVVLRYLLYFQNNAPLNYAQFLTDAAEVGILVPVGSGFRFASYALQATLASQTPTLSSTLPKMKHVFTVPYSLNECRERIAQASISKSLLKKYELDNLSINFIEQHDHWVFTIAKIERQDEPPQIQVFGTLQTENSHQTMVGVKPKIALHTYFYTLFGVVTGIFIMGWTLSNSPEENAVCFFPFGLLLMFGGVGLATNSYLTQQRLVNLIYDALEAPIKSPSSKVVYSLFLICTLGSIVAFVAGLILAGLLYAGASEGSSISGTVAIIVAVIFLAIFLIAYILLSPLVVAYLHYKSAAYTRYDRCLKILYWAERLNPLMAGLFVDFRADTLLMAGRFQEAEALYRKIIQDKKEGDTNTSTSMRGLGEIETDRGNYLQAKEYLERAVEQNPKSMAVCFAAAYLYLVMESDLERSLELIEQAEATYESSWLDRQFGQYVPQIILIMRAWTYVQMDKHEEAKLLLEEALQPSTQYFAPGQALLYTCAARIEWRFGNKERGRELLEKAVALDPDGREGKKAKQALRRMNHQTQSNLY